MTGDPRRGRARLIGAVVVLAALAGAGADARGVTGESEPLLALQDALATFPADRVIVFNHPEGSRDYREDLGLRDAEGRFGVPITYAEISKELD